MRGSRLAIMRGVKAREISARSFVCTGGSVKTKKRGAGTRELNVS